MRMVWLGIIVGILTGVGNANADITFGEPVNLGPVINGSLQDFGASLSTDGLSLFFSSRRSGGLEGYDIWVAARTTVSDDWNEAAKLGPTVNRADHSEWDPSISSDGLELYFSRGPATTGHDLYMTTRATPNDEWCTAVSLGETINSGAEEWYPCISADGLSLYFSSTRAGGQGGQDLYITTRQTKNDAWNAPVNLGPLINRSSNDIAPSITTDGLTLIFSSKRPGMYSDRYDLWMTQRRTTLDPWEEPTNLGPKINTNDVDYAGIAPDGRTLYLFIWNRGGGYGLYDIWQVEISRIVDFNGDGKVDSYELYTMVDRWETDDSVCDIGPMSWGDGIVDVEDLKVLTEHIGKEVVDGTLIAHWALDETEGIVAHDSVGSNDGILLGDPLWEPDAGVVGGTLSFDGEDDCVAVSDAVYDPATGPISILAWVKGGGPGQVILSQSDSDNWLMLDTQGCLKTALKGSFRDTGLTSDVAIADGNWHRVGFVWDGTSRILFVDDVEVARDEQPNLMSSKGDLIIGAGAGLEDGTFWSGLIDDVRIYDRAVEP